MPADPRLHATHDAELVAAYAAGDATGADLAAAGGLVAGCAECATLHRDLRAIMAALPAMPVPVRPRDFRLTPEQAAAIRPPSGLRRLLAPLAGARFAFAGPAGAGLAALGLAGILLSGGLNVQPFTATAGKSLTGTIPQAAASAGATDASGAGAAGAGAGNAGSVPTGGPAFDATAAPAQPSAAASAAPSTAAAVPAASTAPSGGPREAGPTNGAAATSPAASDVAARSHGDAVVSPAASIGAAAPVAVEPSSTTDANPFALAPVVAQVPAPVPAGPSPVAVVSAVLLVVGGVLALLRLAARRLAPAG
jgi:hypothetical protein